jgi:hypothetical protein
VPPLLFATPQNYTTPSFKVRQLKSTSGVIDVNSVGVSGLQMRVC